MGWLRLVGSLKWQVSFAKEHYKRDYILQKRPMILISLLIVATPKVFWFITRASSEPTCAAKLFNLFGRRTIFRKFSASRRILLKYLKHVFLVLILWDNVALLQNSVWAPIFKNCLCQYVEECRHLWCYAHTRACVYMYVYVYLCVCVRVRACARACVCVCVCVSVWKFDASRRILLKFLKYIFLVLVLWDNVALLQNLQHPADVSRQFYDGVTKTPFCWSFFFIGQNFQQLDVLIWSFNFQRL